MVSIGGKDTKYKPDRRTSVASLFNGGNSIPVWIVFDRLVVVRPPRYAELKE